MTKSPIKLATTIKAAQADLRKIGMVLSHEDGEYRVNHRDGKEATAYYTSDLSDAIQTAATMADTAARGRC